MYDKNEMLESLLIRQEQRDAVPGCVSWRLIATAFVIASSAATGTWWWVSMHNSINNTVKTVSPTISADAEIASGSRAIMESASLLDASGYVVARRKATVSAPLGGRLTQVLISEGVHVSEGDVLARLDDAPSRLRLAEMKAQLGAARVRLTAAQTAFDNADQIYQRIQRQSASGFLSPQDLDIAKSSYDSAKSNLLFQQEAVAVTQAQVAIAEHDLSDTVIRAPFAGIVTEKNAQPGEIISPAAAGGSIRTGIGTIVDMTSLEVEVDISESSISQVHPEQYVEITLNAYPNWRIPGHVIATIPSADRAKATLKVRIGFIERDERILPDMGARVAFLKNRNVAP